MIEIIERVTCPTCGGSGKVPAGGNSFFVMNAFFECADCRSAGTVPRVLSTFADRAAMRPILQDALDHAHDANKQEWEDFLTDGQLEAMVGAVLAALGVGDE